MASASCVIWNTRAELLEKSSDFEVYDSPRAGGKYWISPIAAGQVLPLTDLGKQLLTTWLCEQRHAGVEIPRVHANVLDLISSRKPRLVTQRLTAALLFLGRKIRRLGDELGLGGNEEPETLQCMAETECNDATELNELFSMLESTGYIKGTFSLGGYFQVCPTAAGWNELDRLNRSQSDSSQVFVAMWFNGTMTDAYLKGIVPAVAATGYRPIRIDKKEHNNKIDDEIIAEIRRSRFLIADFTCEARNVRGGVYYEAGFAQGLGIPVIWTCKDTSIADLHFDTRQYSHIVWRTTSDLFEQLKNRIGATIGDGPLPKS